MCTNGSRHKQPQEGPVKLQCKACTSPAQLVTMPKFLGLDGDPGPESQPLTNPNPFAKLYIVCPTHVRSSQDIYNYKGPLSIHRPHPADCILGQKLRPGLSSQDHNYRPDVANMDRAKLASEYLYEKVQLRPVGHILG